MLRSRLKSGLYFIAELGQNHQGDINIAKLMVDSLVGSGVSAIKSAKRNIDVCLSEDQKSLIYDNPNSFGKTYYDHRKALELSELEYEELKEYSESKGFDFISSFTDLPSMEFLVNIGTKVLKIASQRVTDIGLLEATARRHTDCIIMSTGMSDKLNIDTMVDIFNNNRYRYLLQCTSVYPCPNNLINLNVMHTYKIMYPGMDGIGFSGHHTSIGPDIAAYTMGYNILERHYTLDRSWKGTDHAASLGADGIKYIIKYTDQIHEASGSSNKQILDEELPAIQKLRDTIK